MNIQIVVQWLPGVVIVAIGAFPAFFFVRQGFVIRLVLATICVLALLSVFGALIGHEFHFLRYEDMPPLVLGLAVGWLLASACRAYVRR